MTNVIEKIENNYSGKIFPCTTHGMSKSVEHKAWRHMKGRCLCPTNHKYPSYGGRGIKICSRWLGKDGFANFFADMGPRPKGIKERYSIDRIDNNSDYCPENSRWSSDTIQARNRRNNVYLTFNGETKTCSEWAIELNISTKLISKRLKRGWSTEETLTKPNMNKLKIYATSN